MASITVELIDEFGNLLERSNINFAEFLPILFKIKDYKREYPLLTYVDPYGDTYLNVLQRPDFVSELKKFNAESSLGGINSLIAFINKAKVHQYIKFIGD